MAALKVVLTNWTALRGKYGGAGLARVRKAIEALVEADGARGIETRVIGLDDAGDMRPYRVRPMGGMEDLEGAKRTVDAVDRKLLPHYILLLGGPDVVPMQRLENPMGNVVAGEDGDQDPFVDSDLPYACDTAFSTDPMDFQGPTRVVGRLPDVPGERKPAYLVLLLEHAAKAVALEPSAYEAWFGVSARAWKKSTIQTVTRLFGDARSLAMSPPATSSAWTKRDLAPRIHFINCHGDLNDPGYYGDSGGKNAKMPTALHSGRLEGRITPGTVLVAECCYGAQLYSPRARRAATEPGRAGIAYEYLKQGAYGVFGATTVSYGPVDHNNYADVICRVFIERVRQGASLGRAALEARQEWIRHGGWMNPLKLKTLGQFFLLGDPSIHPVAGGGAGAPVRRRAANRERLVAAQRARRRERLREEGRALEKARVVLKEMGVSDGVREQMLRIAQEFAMRAKLVRFFSVLAKGSAPKSMAMLVSETKATSGSHGPRYEVILGEVRDGRVYETERVVSR